MRTKMMAFRSEVLPPNRSLQVTSDPLPTKSRRRVKRT